MFYGIKPLNSTLCTLGNYAIHILLSNVITGNMYLIKVTNPNFYYHQLYQFRTGAYTQRYFKYWQLHWQVVVLINCHANLDISINKYLNQHTLVETKVAVRLHVECGSWNLATRYPKTSSRVMVGIWQPDINTDNVYFKLIFYLVHVRNSIIVVIMHA